MLRLAVALAACFLALPRVPSLTAQDLETVDVDISSAAIGGVLPFDEAFLLKGAIGKRVTSVDVRYLETDEAAGLSIDQRGAADRRWDTKVPLLWTRIDGISAEAGPFSVLVPALDVDTRYVFRFRTTVTPTPDDLSRFRNDATTLFAEHVSGMTSKSISDKDLIALRTALAARLVALLGANEFIDTGTLFDPDATVDDVRNAFAKLLRSVWEGYQNRRILARDLAAATDRRRSLASAIRDDQRIDMLLSALRTAAKNDAALGAFLTAHDKGFALASMIGVQLDAMATGGDLSLEGERFLTTVSTSAAATELDRGFRASIERVRLLRKALDMLLVPGAEYHPQLSALTASNPTLAAAATGLTADYMARLTALDDALVYAGTRTLALIEYLTVVEKGLVDLAEQAAYHARSTSLLGGTTIASYETNRKSHVSADAGFLWVFGVERVMPYLGTNIYFRPINKDAPLSTAGCVFQRLALTIGVTVGSIEDDTRGYEDLFGSQAGVVGLGLRVNSIIRLGAGILVLHYVDPNPLLAERSIKFKPYLNASFDIDVANTPIGTWLSAK